MKLAFVLGGGGSRGGYEAGFLRAMKELNYHPDIVTGTSIGALNGALVAQGDADEVIKLWDRITNADVMANPIPEHIHIDSLMNAGNLTRNFFSSYIKEKGIDITPLKDMMYEMYDEKKFYESNIDFGIVTIKYPSLEPLFVKKSMMGKHVVDYLLASSACFPGFPIHTFEEGSFIDGGYYDNCPIDFAFELGATDVIACNLDYTVKQKHFQFVPHIHYVTSSQDIGFMFDFSRDHLDKIIEIGYNDTLKLFNVKEGIKCTFSKTNDNFSSFYYLVLDYERKNKLKGSLYKDALNRSRKPQMTTKDLNYVVVDGLVASLDMEYKEYDYNELVDIILNEYNECFLPSFEVLPELELESLKESLSQHTVISSIVYSFLYPEKMSFKPSFIYKVFTYETLMALWLLNNKSRQKSSNII